MKPNYTRLKIVGKKGRKIYTKYLNTLDVELAKDYIIDTGILFGLNDKTDKWDVLWFW